MHCRWYPSMPCSRSPWGSASVHAGVSQHALQVSRSTTRGKLRGLAKGVSRPTPKGEIEGSGLGGFQAHTLGVSCPTPRGCLQAHIQGLSRPMPRGLQAHTWGVSRPRPRWGGLQAHTHGGLQAHSQAVCIPASTEADPPTATAVGGMHPTKCILATHKPAN